jgi:hypothetical protein
VLITALTVAVLALLAAPVLAAPAPTNWTVSPQSKIITYGQSVSLNGILKSNGVAVGGLWVDFEQATALTGPFQPILKVTAIGGAYSTGTYTALVKPDRTLYYRFHWLGDATYAASFSPVIAVQVKPSLGTPSCPSSAKKGKSFTVKGSVKPGAPSGPAVKVRAFWQKGNTWVSYKTYSTKISGTQYSASIKISQTGKYKFKATTATSAKFAANETSFSKVLTVKK